MRQGRTDAWIAHQLDVTVQQIQAFKREQELEAERKAEEDARAAEEAARKAAEAEDAGEPEEEAKPKRPRRSRSRRRVAGRPLEGTFDHGDEGYGLWLDPAVQDDPVYAEHWAGHRPVAVVVEEDQIVIRRVGEDDEDEG